MNKPIIIIGGGGHAKVVIDMLKRQGAEILGVVDSDTHKHGRPLLGVPVLGGDDRILEQKPGSIFLANGIGSATDTAPRRGIYDKFKDMGYTFATIVHPAAILAEETEIGEGTQVMAGTVIQPGTQIGANCIINTRASVDHDCTIGDHVHIAPGVTLSGNVTIGDGAHLGTGAVVIHNLTIADERLVRAGTVIIRTIEKSS